MATDTLANGKTRNDQVKVLSVNNLGTLCFSNGDKYIGQWKNGAMNGRGVVTEQR